MKLYKKYAEHYDSVYHFKDYKKESNIVLNLIRNYKKSKGKELLDVACGTGTHLKYFKNKFTCTGVDLNKDMLKIAKKKVKGVKFVHGDMTKFKLNKKYDVITCLFSAIGHLKTYSNLQKTIRTFSDHLNKDGILIMEPFIRKKDAMPGTPWSQIYEDKDLKIARLGVSTIKKSKLVLNLHYLVAEKNKKVKYFVDKEELAMYEPKKVLEIMKKENLNSKFSKESLMKDRGLYIGIKK